MRSKHIRTSCLQDVGKGRKQERKLKGSPSEEACANCTFAGNVEILARQLFQSHFQHTHAICGLKETLKSGYMDAAAGELTMHTPEFPFSFKLLTAT